MIQIVVSVVATRQRRPGPSGPRPGLRAPAVAARRPSCSQGALVADEDGVNRGPEDAGVQVQRGAQRLYQLRRDGGTTLVAVDCSWSAEEPQE